MYQAQAPCGAPPSRQYASIIFTRGEAQEKAARASKGRAEIAPFVKFWPAEAYHQKYSLRHNPLMAEFRSLSDADFMNSTAAMRQNAVAAGCLEPVSR